MRSALDFQTVGKTIFFRVEQRRICVVQFSLFDFCVAKGLKGEMEGSRFVLSETFPLETDPTDVAKKIIGLIESLKAQTG